MLDESTAKIYKEYYEKKSAFFRYPNEYVMKFYHLCARDDPQAGPAIPPGRCLDFAFGSGNNAVFFIQQGYEVHGVEVAASSLTLLDLNLRHHGLDPALAERFTIIGEDWRRLPHADNSLNLVVANHVLYYYTTPEAWDRVTTEIRRCLKPGGLFFLSMMAPRHRTCLQAEILPDGLLRTPDGPLRGQTFFRVEDMDALRRRLSDFEEVASGEYGEEWYGRSEHYLWLYACRKPIERKGS